MAQIDLAIFNYALFARNLIYKWERHNDNPADPRFEWSDEDAAALEQLFDYFKTEINPPPDFPFLPKDKSYDQFKDYLQTEIIDNYEQVKGNLPNPELVKIKEEHDRQIQEQLKRQIALNDKLAPARIAFLQKLVRQFPQLDPHIASQMADEMIVAIEALPPDLSLPQVAQEISDLANITRTETSVADVVTILTNEELVQTITKEHELADVVRQVRQIIDQTLGAAATPQSQYLATSLIVASFAKLDPYFQTPPVKLTAALVTKIKPGSNIPSVTNIVDAWEKLLVDPKSPLNYILNLTREIPQYQKSVERKIADQLALSGLTGESRMAAQVLIRQAVLPVLSYSYSQTSSEDDKQVISSIQKVLIRLGLDEYKKGQRVFNQAYQTAYSWAITQDYGYVFSGQLSVQSYYASRYSSSPLVREVFQQFYNLASAPIKDKVQDALIQKFAASQVGQKIFSSLSVKAASTAAAGATVEAGVVAAGAATGPPGWVVAVLTVAAGFIKDKISQASRWVRENWPKVAAATAALAAALLGGFGIGTAAAAGTVGWIGGSALSAGGLNRIGSGASRFFNGIVSLAVTEIATPILVIVLVIPPILALFMFIINNSAYIVPQAVGTFGFSGTGPPGSYRCWPAFGTISQGPPGSGSVCRNENNQVVTCSHVVFNESAVDIGGNMGEIVYASHDGLATPFVNDPTRGYGIWVRIDSPSGFSTIYAHLLSALISTPQQVTVGFPIGLMGNTGNSTGTHLHYEVKPYSASIDSLVPPYQIGGQTSGLFCKDVASQSGDFN